MIQNKDKEKILKLAKEKWLIHCQEIPERLTTHQKQCHIKSAQEGDKMAIDQRDLFWA